MSASSTVLHSAAELQVWLNTAARPLVFTNGCFDILHRGHVSYLQQAAALGQSMLVALNSDASVRGLNKGADRPFNTLEDRLAVISSLGCVDAVSGFDQSTPLELIKSCRPDILVKGGDWPLESIVGCEEVSAYGGVCHSIEFEFKRSTTALVEKIRQDHRAADARISYIDHLVLTVKNIEATVGFYESVLGMHCETFGEDRTALKFGRQKLNLHEHGNEFEPKALHPLPGSQDLCFVTHLDITVVMNLVRQAGVTILQGPINRTGANGEIVSFYFRDPDMNLIEVSTYVKDNHITPQ